MRPIMRPADPAGVTLQGPAVALPAGLALVLAFDNALLRLLVREGCATTLSSGHVGGYVGAVAAGRLTIAQLQGCVMLHADSPEAALECCRAAAAGTTPRAH